MVAVGAICFILMASTAFHLRRRKNNSDESDLQCSNDQIDKDQQHGSDAVAPNSSDSVDEAGAGKWSTNQRKSKKVDFIDLEGGREEPNSVHNKRVAGNINIMTVVDMAESIYVPKLFTRQKKVTDDKQSVADAMDVTPKACKPVRLISRLSPMFSPTKEFSIKMKEQKRRSLAANNQNRSRSMACLDIPSMIHDCSVDSEDSATNSNTSESKPISCIKNKDVQVHKDGVEESYNEVMTDCTRSDAKALSLHHSAESASFTSPYPADVSMGGSLQFTYEEELLNSGKYGDGFSFRDVYFDPENELYECHVPSGPLGIAVDSTQLGLRIQDINPTSPLYNIVSAGDIIIGVDDVDVVGVESCVFWQLVPQRANKHGCCLVIMKI